MKVLVSGSSGLIGSALVGAWANAGHEAVRLVRRGTGLDGAEVGWDPATGRIDAAALEGLDAVVHLAGESIAGRWTPRKKSAIRGSRVDGTRLLCETLAGLDAPPDLLVCASAVGFYGNRGDERLTEESGPGDGFLADVCREWEAATRPAEERGIRVVSLRLGMVLSRRGGALAQMLLPFRLGLGGPVGSGRQWWSWIALDDVVAAVDHVLATPGLRGPVNLVSPEPVTNREFARALGRVLRRPAFLPMPAFAARLALGEMADAAILASVRATPLRLLESGFAFAHPSLEPALQHILRGP